MRYLRVRWLHSHSDEPIELYSEIDSEGFERRKIEMFRDGRVGFASSSENAAGTQLGDLPVPAIEQIALNPEFQPVPITQDEFESVWAQRFTTKVSA